jgi:hypothetical protein
MSVRHLAKQLACHWIDMGKIDALHCLTVILTNPDVEESAGFVRLRGTQLEAPASYRCIIDKYLVAVAQEILMLVQPTVQGLCLIASRRNYNPLCIALWERVKMYMVVPPSVAAVLRTGRADLQRFVCDVYGHLLRRSADPDRITKWIDDALVDWSCPVGSGFHRDLCLVCKAAEIQGVTVSKGASVAFWGEMGVMWTTADHILVALLLIFWKPQYRVRPAEHTPLSLARACQQPWIAPETLCSSTTQLPPNSSKSSQSAWDPSATPTE